MTEAILFLQLINTPERPIGTIIEVFPTERKDRLCGGDISTFLPVMIKTSKYSFNELRQMKLPHGLNMKGMGISDVTLKERQEICGKILLAQAKRIVITPVQVIAPRFDKIVDLDKAGVLFETGFKHPEPIIPEEPILEEDV